MSLMIPHTYTVDIANGTKKEKISNDLIYGDADSHEVTVTVLDGGVPAVLAGYSGILYAVRMADRVTIPNEATIVGNVVTATLAQSCLLVRGRVDLLLTLSKAGGNTISPLWVEANCAGGITGTISDPENIVPNLADLLATVASAEAAVINVEAALDANADPLPVVRYDEAQALTAPQKVQFLDNAGAVSKESIGLPPATIMVLMDSNGGRPTEATSVLALLPTYMPEKTLLTHYSGGAALSSAAALQFLTLLKTVTNGWMCPYGTTYYSDAGLTTPVTTTTVPAYTAYVSATARSITVSGTTRYVSIDDCDRTLLSDAERNAITTILINGGINDTAQTAANIANGVAAICAYAATNYPNAKVLFTFVALSCNASVGTLFKTMVVNACAAGLNGATNGCLVSGSEYALTRYDELHADRIHLATAGAIRAARCIANILRCGQPIMGDTALQTNSYTYSGDASAGGTIAVYCTVFGAIAMLLITFDITVDLSDGLWHEVAKSSSMVNYAGRGAGKDPILTVATKVDGATAPTVFLEIRFTPALDGATSTSFMFARIRGTTAASHRYVLNAYPVTMPTALI